MDLIAVCYIMPAAEFDKFNQQAKKIAIENWQVAERTNATELMNIEETPVIWQMMRNAFRRSMQKAMGVPVDTLYTLAAPGSLLPQDPNGDEAILSPVC